MKQLFTLLTAAGLVACAPAPVDISLEDDGVTLVDPDAELPTEVFYELGGWKIDSSCNEDISATGNAVGQITDSTAVLNQFGEQVNIHDFCGRALLIVTGAFW